MQYVIMSTGFEGGAPGELVELTPEEVNAHIAEGFVFALPHTARRVPAPFRSPEQEAPAWDTEAEIEASIEADAEAEVATAHEAEVAASAEAEAEAEAPAPSAEVSSDPLPETVPEA